MADNDRYFRPGVLLFPLRKYASGIQMRFITSFIRAGMSVLDLGSGPGFFTRAISRAVGPEGIVYSVDADIRAIKKLTERLSRMHIDNVKPHTSSAASIPFVPDGSIDALFSNGLLCCMRDHNDAVNEMVRCMKPGSLGFIGINRFGRDRLGLTKAQFYELLNPFLITEAGSTLTTNWVIVQKP